MEEGELMVEFDGREVTYGFGELDELVLAYATTIHKSQGSEYQRRSTKARARNIQPS
jgi:exodeoxyribonuclease V alpha subunit